MLTQKEKDDIRNQSSEDLNHRLEFLVKKSREKRQYIKEAGKVISAVTMELRKRGTLRSVPQDLQQNLSTYTEAELNEEMMAISSELREIERRVLTLDSRFRELKQEKVERHLREKVTLVKTRKISDTQGSGYGEVALEEVVLNSEQIELLRKMGIIS